MTEAEQVNALADDLMRVINRYSQEFDLTFAAAIGTLEMVKIDMWHEYMTGGHEEDNDHE